MTANQARYPVVVMCRVLGVSTSGYYAWQKRPPSKRARENAELTEEIREIHEWSRGTYGAPRSRSARERRDDWATELRVLRGACAWRIGRGVESVSGGRAVLLAEAAGRWLVHRADTSQDPWQAAQEDAEREARGEGKRRDEDPLPPEVEAEGRKSSAARFDFGWLWSELGLEELW